MTGFKEIGDLGANIFLREAQLIWSELCPIAEEKWLDAARKLCLPETPNGLADLVPQAEFPRLEAALVRAAP